MTTSAPSWPSSEHQKIEAYTTLLSVLPQRPAKRPPLTRRQIRKSLKRKRVAEHVGVNDAVPECEVEVDEDVVGISGRGAELLKAWRVLCVRDVDDEKEDGQGDGDGGVACMVGRFTARGTSLLVSRRQTAAEVSVSVEASMPPSKKIRISIDEGRVPSHAAYGNVLLRLVKEAESGKQESWGTYVQGLHALVGAVVGQYHDTLRPELSAKRRWNLWRGRTGRLEGFVLWNCVGFVLRSLRDSVCPLKQRKDEHVGNSDSDSAIGKDEKRRPMITFYDAVVNTAADTLDFNHTSSSTGGGDLVLVEKLHEWVQDALSDLHSLDSQPVLLSKEDLEAISTSLYTSAEDRKRFHVFLQDLLKGLVGAATHLQEFKHRLKKDGEVPASSRQYLPHTRATDNEARASVEALGKYCAVLSTLLDKHSHTLLEHFELLRSSLRGKLDIEWTTWPQNGLRWLQRSVAHWDAMERFEGVGAIDPPTMRLWRPFVERTKARVLTIEMAKGKEVEKRDKKWWEGVVDELLKNMAPYELSNGHVVCPSSEEEERHKARVKSWFSRPGIKARLDALSTASGSPHHGQATLLQLWLFKAAGTNFEHIRRYIDIDDKVFKTIADPTSMKLILAGHCCAGCDAVVQAIQTAIRSRKLKKVENELELPRSDGVYRPLALLPYLPSFLVRDVAKELEKELKWRLEELALNLQREEIRKRNEQARKRSEEIRSRRVDDFLALFEAGDAKKQEEEKEAEALKPEPRGIEDGLYDDSDDSDEDGHHESNDKDGDETGDPDDLGSTEFEVIGDDLVPVLNNAQARTSRFNDWPLAYEVLRTGLRDLTNSVQNAEENECLSESPSTPLEDPEAKRQRRAAMTAEALQPGGQGWEHLDDVL